MINARTFLSLFLSPLVLLADDSTPITTERLTQLPTQAWLTNGGNIFNQRYSPLDQINTGNVNALKGVWRARLNGSGVGPPYSGEAQPIVHDGVIYVITGADDVFAISVATGEFLWVYESGLSPAISTVCCGWTSRGVAIGEGKLFLGRLDNELVALDLKTGAELWSVKAERWEDGYTITSAPLYYDGLVITGFAGAEYGTRGRVKAFKAGDGAHAWTFYTIPGPGEFGHDTWPQGSEIWKKGGANVWQTPAVDPALGLLYFSTANPGPDFNGAVRAGDNLFTDSILALDVATGAYRWHFQQVRHDIWDYDASSPVVLFSIDIDGQPRNAIAQAGKTGWVYILDRITGEPLLGIEERSVPQEPRQLTAATQPVPIGDAYVPQSMDMPMYGYPLVNQGRIFTPFWDRPVTAKPSAFGATPWAPPSYDPRTHTLFICAIDMPGVFIGGARDSGRPGLQFLGGEFSFPFARSGIFAAMNLQTNRLVWRQRWQDICYSGSAATAGNLVFTGQNDGRFVALDARDGGVLWEFQTGAGVNAPPSVFEYLGEQYVVVYAAGALFANSPPGDNVWLFSLTGTLDPVPPPDAVQTQDIVLEGANTDAGKNAYERFCAQCHGVAGEGGHGGGPALHQQSDAAQVAATVAAGRGHMPAMAPTLSSEQIRDIAVYVATKLEQKAGAGP